MSSGIDAELYNPADEREEQGDLPTEQHNDKTEQPAHHSDRALDSPPDPDNVAATGERWSGGRRYGRPHERAPDAGFGHA
jgi:hypothetical protein